MNHKLTRSERYQHMTQADRLRIARTRGADDASANARSDRAAEILGVDDDLGYIASGAYRGGGLGAARAVLRAWRETHDAVAAEKGHHRLSDEVFLQNAGTVLNFRYPGHLEDHEQALILADL